MALVYHGRRIDLNKLPIGEEVNIPKPGLDIGPDFEVTFLGHAQGAAKQFRGPLGAHLREFPDLFKLHRDEIDPRTDPLGHLVKDAPDDVVGIAAGGVCAFMASKSVYESRKDVSDHALLESILVGSAVGVGTYFIGKWITRLLQSK
ncbi:MAG: hypothetical protein LYZ70_01600 [Nitrososphaerales archaeon]|nr:hypothetical protein [Nitrososphaerales archaeon]